MLLSKALQTWLAHSTRTEEVISVYLKCKGKTSKSMLIWNKNPFMKMLIHAVSLFSHWKRMKISQEQSLELQVIRCSLCDLLTKSILQERNRESFFPLFSLKTACEVCSIRLVQPSVSAGSALFRWMTQFLIDVFSKALLVQSLPVLVLFREITNYSANPTQSSPFKPLEEPVPRTAPRYLGEKYNSFDNCS